MQQKRDDDPGAFNYFYQGPQLALTVVIFFLLGYWLDKKFGTYPAASVVGGCCGVAAGLYNFLRAFYGKK